MSSEKNLKGSEAANAVAIIGTVGVIVATLISFFSKKKPNNSDISTAPSPQVVNTILPDKNKFNHLGKLPFRTLIIVLATILLCLLFLARPIRLNSGIRSELNKQGQLKPTNLELVKIELEKGIDEIKLRMEEEDSWFHDKFILVGGLLAFFLGYVGGFWGVSRRGRRESDTKNESLDEKNHEGRLRSKGRERDLERNTRLESLLKSNWTCSVLALACVVALAIDMHLRNNIIVIQQIALWTAYYVEPAYLGIGFDPQNTTGFVPWEQFLRLEKYSSMHRDELYGLGFNTHLHFLTGVLYIIYLVVFQNVCIKLCRDRTLASQRQQQIAFTGFLFVHVSALAFSWIAHSAPGTCEVNLIPFGKLWVEGWISSIVYLLPVLGLVLICLPYLRCLTPSLRGEIR